MSKLQKLARTRNWAKYKVKGLHVPKQGLTDHEQKVVQAIYNLQEMLLRTWDKEYEKLKTAV